MTAQPPSISRRSSTRTLLARPREIRGGDQAVVAAADDDGVVPRRHAGTHLPLRLEGDHGERRQRDPRCCTAGDARACPAAITPPAVAHVAAAEDSASDVQNLPVIARLRHADRRSSCRGTGVKLQTNTM